MESIDALAKAVNEFEGGMVLVSHDMRLISQVAQEIWICDHKTITMYKGDIQNFKMDMRAQMHLDDDKDGNVKPGGRGQLRGDASVMKKTTEELDKGKAKKEATKTAKAQQNGNGKKSGSDSALDSLLTPKQRDESELNDAWDVQEINESLPKVNEPQATAPKKYIPPHLRNKQ
jgi:ABC-type multidrug transport system ATPase subunit